MISSGTPLPLTSKLWRHIGWFLDCRRGGREGERGGGGGVRGGGREREEERGRKRRQENFFPKGTEVNNTNMYNNKSNTMKQTAETGAEYVKYQKVPQ